MDTIANRPPTSFWIVAALLLVWGLIGCGVYLSEVGRDLSALPLDEQRLHAAAPVWAWAAFAIAVWVGLAGALALLLRRKLAIPLYIVSLVGIIVQDIYWLGVADTIAVMGGEAIVMPIVVVLIALFSIWYSRRAHAHGWLR